MLQIGCQAAVLLFLTSIGGNKFNVIVCANILLGLSMSSITPTTITMSEHFMDMTSKLRSNSHVAGIGCPDNQVLSLKFNSVGTY